MKKYGISRLTHYAKLEVQINVQVGAHRFHLEGIWKDGIKIHIQQNQDNHFLHFLAGNQANH